MNEFLTEKAQKKRIWEIPVAVVCILFAAAGISVLCGDIQSGNGFRDFAIDIVMTLLFMWPVFRIVSVHHLKREANRFASCFQNGTEQEIPFSRLDQYMNRRSSIRILKKLVEKGFLQHIRLDLKNGAVVLEKEGETLLFADRKCPGCGAALPAALGHTVRCEFCGKIVALPPKEK